MNSFIEKLDFALFEHAYISKEKPSLKHSPRKRYLTFNIMSGDETRVALLTGRRVDIYNGVRGDEKFVLPRLSLDARLDPLIRKLEKKLEDKLDAVELGYKEKSDLEGDQSMLKDQLDQFYALKDQLPSDNEITTNINNIKKLIKTQELSIKHVLERFESNKAQYYVLQDELEGLHKRFDGIASVFNTEPVVSMPRSSDDSRRDFSAGMFRAVMLEHVEPDFEDWEYEEAILELLKEHPLVVNPDFEDDDRVIEGILYDLVDDGKVVKSTWPAPDDAKGIVKYFDVEMFSKLPDKPSSKNDMRTWRRDNYEKFVEQPGK